MNLDLYSDRAKQAVQSAQSLALARRHQQFAPEHLLKVLLEERDGLARNLITAAGGDAKRAEADVETALSKRAQVSGGSGQLYLDGDTARVFAAAEYLPEPPRVDMPIGQAVAVHLELHDPGERATGYRMEILPPAAAR